MKNVSSIDKVMPKWTKRVVTEVGGRDPLGLSRVSLIITDYLLSGIITTTDRARYYSFYCWALWHIDKEDAPKKYQDFVDGLRRREAAVALATISNNPETSPVGVVAARAQLEKGIKEKEVNCNFRVLPSNSLGGYGQYYAGCLYQLGLTYRPEDGIDRVTVGDAEVLAKTLHSTVEKTPYIKKRLYRKAHMPIDDLFESKEYLTLDALWEPFAKYERQKLIELFFGLSEQSPSDRTILRRDTLAQILYIISEYQKHGFYANLKKLDWYLVYPTYYYDVLWPIDDKTLPYECPKAFEICYSLWKQFCLQQFLTQAIEGLMYSVLEVVGIEDAGLRIDEVISRLIQHEFFSILKYATGKLCNKPCELFTTFGIDSIPDEQLSLRFQNELSLLNTKSEVQILNLEQNSPQAAAAQGIILLSVLYGKWRGIRDDYGFSYVANHAGSELWAGNILPHLDCWLKEETSWEDALRSIIEIFIVNQHDRIMYEKRRLDSCWLKCIEGRICKVQDYSSRWRSSRHRNAVSIFRDLGLIMVDGDGNISITSKGEEILNKILR